MPTNSAAWQVSDKKHPFEVKEAPYPEPSAEEVVIKNAAVAINPVDWKLQRHSIFPMPYPTIFGEDVAGEVVEVGSSVSNVKKGDRVAAHAHSLANEGAPKYGGFQQYTLHNHKIVSVIPSSLSFEQAAVLPLAISTAAAGLYEKDFLNMTYPSLSPKPAGESVLIWGGSSSVGSLAIQLAKASGYEVVTTASPRNSDYVKGLGADQVLDYNSKTIVNELVDAFKGKTVVGAYDSIASGESTVACAEVLSRTKGGKFVACVLPPPENLPKGTSSGFLLAANILHTDVSTAVWIDYVPEALKQGKLQAKPDAMVVGKGLQDIQMATDRQSEGVSAAKIVCTI